MRDALATALTLDPFNRNADEVDVAGCAQLVNNIIALFLCHEERVFATPNFDVLRCTRPTKAGNLFGRSSQRRTYITIGDGEPEVPGGSTDQRRARATL